MSVLTRKQYDKEHGLGIGLLVTQPSNSPEDDVIISLNPVLLTDFMTSSGVEEAAALDIAKALSEQSLTVINHSASGAGTNRQSIRLSESSTSKGSDYLFEIRRRKVMDKQAAEAKELAYA